MEIIRNKPKWEKYKKTRFVHYNVEEHEVYENPLEYPCISIPQLISDINGARIKFNFIYRKDCKRLLKDV